MTVSDERAGGTKDSDSPVADGTATCPECDNEVFYRITKPAPNAAKVVYFGSPMADRLRAAKEVVKAYKNADYREASVDVAVERYDEVVERVKP